MTGDIKKCGRIFLMKLFTLVFLILIGPNPSISQDFFSQRIRGRVFDSIGLPVSGARISIKMRSGENSNCKTNQDGKFECRVNPNENFVLFVKADGFTILRRNFNDTQDLNEEFEFSLSPEVARGTVVVTAGRTESLANETPWSVVSLTRKELESTASPALDDALRQTVGFSLFRRSNSRNANPTSQGTSLRGVNSSGASRTLILFDDVPVNDPFGGWVQWSRLPSIGVGRIEVLRGGSSSLYGSDSIAGTIIVVPRGTSKADDEIVSAEFYGGTQKTLSGSTFLGITRSGWAGDITASSFQTMGYRIVEKSQGGAVDDFANSRSDNFSGRITRNFDDVGNIFLRATYFGESRNNGTPVQMNRTHSRQLAFGGDFDISRAVKGISPRLMDSKIRFRMYGGRQVFDQTFSAVGSDRNSENLVRVQRVPSQSLGISVQFSTVHKNHALLSGAELTEVRGSSDETGFFGGFASTALGSGGRETASAIYFQDFIRLGERAVFVGNLRYDSWENRRALTSTRRFATNSTTTTVFQDRGQTAWSPGVSLLHRPTRRISLYLNASRSFRAPTLNELYRGFRVGDVITEPNEDLTAERANSYEGGMIFSARQTFFRGNLYRTDISDSIANITISNTPALFLRQRQNAGKIQIHGFEFEAEKRILDFRFSFGYLLAAARFAEFPSNIEIEGLRIPQVPVHQYTFQANYGNSNGLSLSLQGRGSAGQFEDDTNTFRLESYFQLDAFAAKRLNPKLQMFAGIENAFNSRYSVGKTPVRTISSPVNVRVGIRWN